MFNKQTVINSSLIDFATKPEKKLFTSQRGGGGGVKHKGCYIFTFIYENTCFDTKKSKFLDLNLCVCLKLAFVGRIHAAAKSS